jgi:antitoxin MazE
MSVREIAMAHAVNTRLIRIGNSQGIRIPKALIEQAGLRDAVKIQLDGDRLVIFAAQHPRAGWDDAFRAMADQHDDALLDADVPTLSAWDLTDWQW